MENDQDTLELMAGDVYQQRKFGPNTVNRGAILFAASGMAAGSNVALLSAACFDPGNSREGSLTVASFGTVRGPTAFGRAVSTAAEPIGPEEIRQLGGECTCNASLSPVRTVILTYAACGIVGSCVTLCRPSRVPVWTFRSRFSVTRTPSSSPASSSRVLHSGTTHRYAGSE